jgi:hypothetical protein
MATSILAERVQHPTEKAAKAARPEVTDQQAIDAVKEILGTTGGADRLREMDEGPLASPLLERTQDPRFGEASQRALQREGVAETEGQGGFTPPSTAGPGYSAPYTGVDRSATETRTHERGYDEAEHQRRAKEGLPVVRPQYPYPVTDDPDALGDRGHTARASKGLTPHRFGGDQRFGYRGSISGLPSEEQRDLEAGITTAAEKSDALSAQLNALLAIRDPNEIKLKLDAGEFDLIPEVAERRARGAVDFGWGEDEISTAEQLAQRRAHDVAIAEYDRAQAKAQSRANPRTEALRRRFEAGDELEAAEAELEAAETTYDKDTIDAATKKRDTARENVERFGTTIEGVGGRFSPATPPEGISREEGLLTDVDTGKTWRAKPRGTLAAMDQEIAQMEADLAGRAAWLREQGSPAVGSVKAQTPTPTIRAGLAEPQQQIADLKDRIEQKKATRDAYQAQQQDLLNDIQAVKDARVAAKEVSETMKPEWTRNQTRIQTQTQDTPQPRTTPRGEAVKEQVDDGWGASGYGS